MKSKKYAKRLLSFIIASVMIVTMLPVSALAAGVDDVMIEDQAETIVEEAVDVSGEVVEEAAEVPDIENSEDAAIVDGAVDEIAEAETEELTGFTDGNSLSVEGVLSGSNMQFDAQLAGLSVSAVVPVKRAAKGSVMTADIVDVSEYADAVAKKNYGKSIAGLYGLELHFYDKKGKEIKHINTSDITVTVDGFEASSYFIGRIDNKVKKIQRGTEPTFTFTEKKAYTYVIAGLEDDGLVRASGESDGDGNKRFNLNDENVDIEVVAPEGAFADGVAMEASDVTNGAAEDGEDALVGASADDIVAAYNISFYNEDGAEQQPSEAVTVTINVPLDMTKSYELIHIADDGTINSVPGAVYTENGVEFMADSFSTYAVVNSITSGLEYVIYTTETTSNNVLAHSGSNLDNVTASVSSNSVDSDADNIKWTFTSNNGGYRISYRSGDTTYYLTTLTDDGNLTVTNNANNAKTWFYDSTNHYLYYNTTSGNIFWTQTTSHYIRDIYRTGGRRTTDRTDRALEIYLALEQGGSPTGDLTYYYYSADGTPILGSESGSSQTTWTDVSTLAKTIDGYHYLEARANSSNGDVIYTVSGKYYRKGNATTGTGSALNSVYFIYMKDYVPDISSLPNLEGPDLKKDVTDNEDGTFKIRLEITGKTNEVEHGANVLVVFDRTYSMSSSMGGTDNKKRIDAAISAVNKMVETLNPGKGEGQHDIDFALVEFDRAAEAFNFRSDGINGHTYWTKSGTALNERIGRYANVENLASQGSMWDSSVGGTNWQIALQEAAKVLEDKPDGDITYVVFMTDGQPTYYIDATSVNSGAGEDDPEYKKAVPYAKAIVQAGYHMWDIFCSDTETTTLASLKADSNAENYVKAETTKAIEDAFVAVANAMLEAIGSQNAAANDGIPKMGAFDLDTVDGEVQLSNAKYSIFEKREEDQEPQWYDWEDAPPATPLDTGGVKWDLSSENVLKDGAKYAIEFDIWPSQEAYDLIADLNNKKLEYEEGHDNSITAEQRAQVEPVEGTTDEYRMKTNTSLTMSYELYGETHNDVITTYVPGAMDLPTGKLSIIQKIWPTGDELNQLDDIGKEVNFVYRDENGNPQPAPYITLTLWRSGTEGDTKYIENIRVNNPNMSSDSEEGEEPTSNEEDEVIGIWDYTQDIYIACGNMSVSKTPIDEDHNNTFAVSIHEEGHDYWLTEPAEFSYYWDLISDIYHPMVINGHATVLVEIDDVDAPDSMPSDDNIKFTDTDSTVYYRFSNKVYKVKGTDMTSGNTLHGTNLRRSNLNLTKKVDIANPEDIEFTFTAKVTDSMPWADEQGRLLVWFSATKEAKTEDEVPEIIKDEWVISGAEREMKGGEPTGYWYATNGAEIKFKIKAGWNVRFLNLYHGSEFIFEETDTSDYFEFDSVSAEATYDFMDNKISDQDWWKVDATNTKRIEGSVIEPNNSYKVTFENKALPNKFFYVFHSGAAGDGNLEAIKMPAEGETYDLTQNLTEDTLYGGYYLDYAGKGDYNDDGKPGKTGVAYTGMNNFEWSGAQTISGEAITPVANETYYIKEVPAYYLRNYHQLNYSKVDGELKALFLISAIDDLNYQETGFILKSTDKQRATKIVQKISFRNLATSKTVTLQANTVFKSIGGKLAITEPGENLTYFDITDTEYFAVGAFTVLPYWKTPDGISVNGISTRTITITELTRLGVTKKDG